jgi:hypothetical protein
MDAGVLLVLGLGVLLLVVIAFIVVNESRKRAAEDSLRNTADEYIRNQNSRNEALARELDLDPDEIQAWIDEAYQAECMVPPPCPGLTVEDEETGCCVLTDEEMTKFQKAMKITESILYSVAVSYGFSKVVGGAYAASKQGARITRSAVQRMSRSMGRVAARGATKVATRTSVRYGLGFLTKAAAKVGMGPAGLAVLAMELVSFALDMADPFGFNSYQANKVSQNMRNAYEVEVQKSTMEGTLEERTDFPIIFPLALAYPEHNDEFFEAYMGRFTVDAMELIPEDQLTNVIVNLLLGEGADAVLSEEEIEDAGKAFENAFQLVDAVKRVERDEFIYSFYKDKGLESKIERVPFMSTARRYGVTLSKEGCNQYNTRMEPLHVKYATIDKRYGRSEECLDRETEEDCTAGAPPSDYASVGVLMREVCKWDKNEGENGTCIDAEAELYPEGGYTPLVALYTDTYRVVNPETPGGKSTPNVFERKLPGKCALASPLGSVVEHCLELNKHYNGVTFNYETGYCDYTSDFCKSYGMRFRNNDCELYPGQDLAQIVFGTTVTNFSIIVGNKARDFYNKIADAVGDGVDTVGGVVDTVGGVVDAIL